MSDSAGEVHTGRPEGAKIMREFFRGWKRKIGCIALLTACAATVMLVRSRTVLDQVWLRAGRTMYTIASAGDKVEFEIFADLRGPEPDLEAGEKTDCFPMDLAGFWALNYSSEDLAAISELIPQTWAGEGGNPFRSIALSDQPTIWRWAWAGFRFEKAIIDSTHQFEIYLIPYWSIICPISLHSAYLLLSTRGRRKNAKSGI